MTTRHKRASKAKPNRFASGNAIRMGQARGLAKGDLYHFLLRISWPAFLLIVIAFYLSMATVFAGLYLVGGANIAHVRPGSFQDAFFYSMDIISTLGYRETYPLTVWAKTVGVLQSLVGLLQLAVLTGLAYARFSKPNARMAFSRVAVVTPVDGIPTLLFRVANQRSNLILQANARAVMVQNVVTREGRQMRRLKDLKLVRHESPVFNLSWTIMHPIDADSPFYGVTPEELAEKGTEVIVIVAGTDEVLNQVVHGRHSYSAGEIRWGVHFVDIISYTEDGRIMVDYARFNEVIPDEDPD